jgi:hypothetical protein
VRLSLKIAAGAALGAALLTAASPGAEAQSGSRHRPKPPPQIIEVPPPPLGPRSLGLLEQDFQRMRATSPNPNNFHYGRWNPQFQTIQPRSGGFFGGGFFYGYPGYIGYPAYPVYPYGGYPYGAGYGYYGQPPVVQRDIIVIPQPQPRQEERPRVEPPRAPEDRPQPAQQESITDALDDIRKAWLNGDLERVRARLTAGSRVRLYPNGDYRYAVDAAEFGSMLQNAMKSIDTISFEFDRPKSEEAGRAFVTGKHVYVDAENSRRTTYVSYTLQRVDGRWKIVEAGSSADPITAHRQ